MHLKTGTYLQGDKYRIISVLGQGGFGITYLAEHELASRNVCIKEFFPKEYYNRDVDSLNATLGSIGSADAMERFKEKFIKEAKTIARLDHPNIIHIHDVFKENNTCYYVMDYIDGESLHSLVKRSGALSEDVAKSYMREACAAIEHIHAMHINHLDIKPGNIMIRKSDNRAIVIDFGLAKQYDDMGNQTSSSPVGISHGYAPMEQYKQGGVSEFTPATDVYSLGATLYYLVTGVVPPQASDVAEDGLPELPAHLSEGVKRAIEGAMQSRRKDRVQSVAEFVKLFDGDAATAATIPPVTAAPVVEPTPIAVPTPGVSFDDSTELGTALGGAPHVDEECTELGAMATPKPESKKEWTPRYATDNPKSNAKGGGLKKLVFILVAALLFGVIAGFVSSLFTSNDETQAESKTDEEKVIELLEEQYIAALNSDIDKYGEILSALYEYKNSVPNYTEILLEWDRNNPEKADVTRQFHEEFYEVEYSEEVYIEEYPAEACCEEYPAEACDEDSAPEGYCEESAPEVYYDEYGGYSYYDDFGNLIYVDQYGDTYYYYFDEYGNMYSEDGELVLAANE